MHLVNIERQCKLYESGSALFFCCRHKLVAVNVCKLLCALFDVFAVIAVLRQLDSILALENLLVADIK